MLLPSLSTRVVRAEPRVKPSWKQLFCTLNRSSSVELCDGIQSCGYEMWLINLFPTHRPARRPPTRPHPRYSAAISGIAVPHTEWQNSPLKIQSLIKNTVIKDSSKVFLWLEHFPVSRYRTGTNHASLCKRGHPQPSHVVERTA